MEPAEYILALLAIISGLAISEMVVSLHRLLVHRRNVRWDWLTLVAAAFVFLLIVSSWGVSYRAFNDLPLGPWFWEFVLNLCQLIGIYLAARGILPDDIGPSEHVDLVAHYAFISRYVWTSLSVTYALYLMFAIMFAGIEQLAARWEAIVGLVVIGALAMWSSRRFHQLAVPALFALMCASTLPERLLLG